MSKAWENVVQMPAEGRSKKPRTSGLTMVIDKGLGLHRLEDLIQTAGEYIDIIKLTFGTSAFYDEDLLKTKLANLEYTKKETEKVLSPDVLDRYRKIENVRDGIVIARVSSAVCGACNMRIRLQRIAELKKRDQLFECEAFNRFLYWSLEPLPFEAIEGLNEDGKGDGAEGTDV